MRFVEVPCVRFYLVAILLCLLATIGLAQGIRSTPSVDTKNELYFPGVSLAWETVGPVKAGWDSMKLDETLAWAGKVGSSGVVVLFNGRILAEQYWDEVPTKRSARYQRMFMGVNEQGQPIEDVASVQKSVTSILVGIAQQNDLLRIENPVSEYLGVGWSNSTPQQESRITLRHLLSMTSGLNEELRYVAPVGTRWFYNTAAYAKSRDCLVSVSGMSIHELTREWLTDVIGSKESKWTPRPAGIQALNAFGFSTTARDLARVGLLMQAEGNWAGNQVLKDAGFRVASTRPSQRLRPSYGYFWWSNRSHRINTAPLDTYSANGALGRRVYVAPSQGLVVVRLGDEPKMTEAKNFDREFWRRLMAARLPTASR
ncbi:MAG: serine hydrolase [Rubripirellula sp.]|nr:serine hydrolase [Rubripirellula sp.]